MLLVEDNPVTPASSSTCYVRRLQRISSMRDDVHVESLAPVDGRSGAASMWYVDRRTPRVTGLATLDRATEIIEGVPIIVLTGMQDREMAVEAINRGAQDYLPKADLDGDRLVRALRYAVVRSRQQRAISARPTRWTSSTASCNTTSSRGRTSSGRGANSSKRRSTARNASTRRQSSSGATTSRTHREGPVSA